MSLHPAPLLSAGAATPGGLSPVLDSPVRARHGHTGTANDREDREEADRAGIV